MALDVWQRLERQDNTIEELKEQLERKVPVIPERPPMDPQIPQILHRLDNFRRELDTLSTKVVEVGLPINKICAVVRQEVFAVLKENGIYAEPMTDMTGEYRSKMITTIVNVVEEKWHVGIINENRKQNTCLARYVAMYLLREMLCLPFPQIGAIMSRHHATVIHGCSLISTRVKRSLEFAMSISDLRRQIQLKAEQPDVTERDGVQRVK